MQYYNPPIIIIISYYKMTDFENVILKTYRFKFSPEMIEELSYFAQLHKYNDNKEFKEAWKKWIETEDISHVINNEIKRLTALGNETNILANMYKSARYYHRKKTPPNGNDLENENNNNNIENKDTSPKTKRKYTSFSVDILEIVNTSIASEIKNNMINNISHISPAEAYANFCDMYSDSINREIKYMQDEYKEHNLTHAEIVNKLKKTYKNRYFIIKRENDERREHVQQTLFVTTYKKDCINIYIPISNNLDTQTIEIKLTDNIRTLLNDQKKIEEEMKFNVTELIYNEFVSYVNRQLQDQRQPTCITYLLLKQLFEQYPELDRIKDTIIISTFRTSFTRDGGLNGESNFHIDNILFPRNKDRNLIITWGLGTEAFTIESSSFITKLNHEILRIHYANNFLENLDTFTNRVFEYPDKSIDELLHEPEYKYEEGFKEIVNNLVKQFTLDNPRILKSSAPNKEGNITALIMSGKDVYHRREPIVGQAPSYRYVLNIYFNSKDIGVDSEDSSKCTSDI